MYFARLDIKLCMLRNLMVVNTDKNFFLFLLLPCFSVFLIGAGCYTIKRWWVQLANCWREQNTIPPKDILKRADGCRRKQFNKASKRSRWTPKNCFWLLKKQSVNFLDNSCHSCCYLRLSVLQWGDVWTTREKWSFLILFSMAFEGK